MAVEKLPDGTYQVGGMIFATAEQAFYYDASRAPATAPPPAATTARDSAPKPQVGMWAGMTPASRAGVIVVGIVCTFLLAMNAIAPIRPETSTVATQSPQSRPAPVAQTETELAAAREKRVQEIKTACTTDLSTLLADAKALLANNDPAMASARLNLCNGVSNDKAFLGLIATAERQRVEKNAKAQRDEAARKKKEGVHIGMSKEDVLASMWGKPQKVNTTTTVGGTREQWVYGGHSYLYFTGEVLTAIQN